MRSLRDMNMSKLVFDDIALFEGLLKDIFPRQTSVDKVNHAQVEPRIPVVMKKRPELINRPEFTLKIIQVYETSEVRHGFMLLGLSITGKTTILNILT
jgi:dynein heavy chain, axonemal